jgi:transposase
VFDTIICAGFTTAVRWRRGRQRSRPLSDSRDHRLDWHEHDYTRLREDLIRERRAIGNGWKAARRRGDQGVGRGLYLGHPLGARHARSAHRREQDPRRLADLARGRLRAKRSELLAALDSRFDDHHAELARLLLAQIDSLTAQIDP